MLLASGGLALADAPFAHALLLPLPLPDGIEEGRYYFYRRG
jgi:hypothetical protein